MSYTQVTGRVAFSSKYPQFAGKPQVVTRFTRTDEKWTIQPSRPGYKKAIAAGKIVINNQNVGSVVNPEPQMQASATLGFKVNSDGVIAATDGFDLWDTTAFRISGLDSLQKWRGPLPERKYDALLAEALAASNAGEIDFLTTLAEAGESIEMLITAYKTVKNPMKHFASLRRQFSSMPLPAMTPRLVRLRENNIKKFLIEYERRLIKQKQRWDAKKLKYPYDPRKTLNEVLNAAAALNLTWRYGVMPNVYLFESAVKLAKTDLRPIFRTRVNKREVREISVSDPILVGSLSQSPSAVMHNCGSCVQAGTDLLKVCVISNFAYSNPNERLMRHEFDFNILKTAWELFPLSFVVDWFVNIGDWLGSFFPPSGLHERGVMLSRKYDVSTTALIADQVWDYPFGSQNTHVVTIGRAEWFQHYSCATREDISSSFPSIQLRPQMNFARAADAASLFKLLVLK